MVHMAAKKDDRCSSVNTHSSNRVLNKPAAARLSSQYSTSPQQFRSDKDQDAVQSCLRVQVDGNTHLLQPKLTVGSTDDEHEKEADRVAEVVMRMPEGRSSSVANPSQSVGASLLQRKSTQPGSAVEAPAVVQQSLRSGSQTLPASTRSFFEPRFGHDLSNVQVHTDATANDASKAVHARAFTVGNHIVFRQGEYQPDSQSGRQLLAHELTHVLQQRGSDTSNTLRRVPATAAQKAIIDSEIENAADRYDKVFESQKLELHAMMGQINEADPPPLWQTLLVAAAQGALVAATGGIGSIVGIYAAKKAASAIAATTLTKATQAVVSKVCGDIAKDVAKAGIKGLTGGMQSAFNAAVLTYPVANDERMGNVFINSQIQNLINNSTKQGEALRAKKSQFYNEGENGVAAVIAIKNGLDAPAYMEARAKQRNETVQNWAVFLAHSDYGTSGKGSNTSTDMSKGRHFWSNLGILQINGEWHSGSRPSINSAKIDGLNQHLRPEISKTKIKNLRIPISCVFDVGYDVHWLETKRVQEKVTLKRDEKGNVWAGDPHPGIVPLARVVAPQLTQLNMGRHSNFYTLSGTPHAVIRRAFDFMGNMKVNVN